MAELDVGQHCQVQHCRQRDFLPFVCDGCSGIFCLEHRSKDSHGCPEVNVVKERPKTDEHKSYSCSFKECTEVELVAVICPYCEKNFCLRHRHQSDHGCEKLEIPKPRMAATQKLVKDIIDTKAAGAVSKGRKGAKTSGTATKVALMKLKMHADGDKSLPQVEFILNSGVAGGYEGSLQSRSESLELDIEKRAPSAPVPEHKKTERIYFQVYLPKGSKEKSKAMFFCLRWSIGKVVDFAASLASLRNENNKLTAKKLRLCHVPSGEALPLDHTLETWITKESSPLYNGGNVILEYLNDEEQILKNVDSYLE